MNIIFDLYKYGKSIGLDDSPIPLKTEKIHYYIDLFDNGSFEIVKSKNEFDEYRLISKGQRTGTKTVSNPRVNMLWDFFGWYGDKSPKEFSDIFWKETIKILSDAKETNLASLVTKISKKINLTELSKKYKENETFALRYNSELIFFNKNVQNYLTTEAEEKDRNGNAFCLISGKQCVPVLLHSEIKIPGFKEGISPLISFNKDVFKTGNLDQGNNFPVSGNVVNTYTAALESLAKNCIKIKDDVAVIIWSDTNSKNVDSIRKILNRESCWTFTETSGNIHFLAMTIEQKRRSILAYDVVPESVVINNLMEFKKKSLGLFDVQGVKASLVEVFGMIEGKKAGSNYSSDDMVQFFRTLLFNVPYSQTLKKNIISNFNKVFYQKSSWKDGYLSYKVTARNYIKWVEFFLLQEAN